MNLEKFRNKLIIFEGMDKTGKTSVARELTNKLNENNIETIFTFQPGDDKYSVIAPFLRSFCKDNRWNLHPLTNLFMFLADRTEQISKVVEPALQEGKTVICDRWWYSTYAYQLCGKNVKEEYSFNYNIIHVFDRIEPPDFVFYFPEKVYDKNEDNFDLFEMEEDNFHSRVKEGYEVLAKLYNFIYIYPGNSIEKTLEKIIKI